MVGSDSVIGINTLTRSDEDKKKCHASYFRACTKYHLLVESIINRLSEKGKLLMISSFFWVVPWAFDTANTSWFDRQQEKEMIYAKLRKGNLIDSFGMLGKCLWDSYYAKLADSCRLG